MPRALAITLSVFAALLFVCSLRYAPPSPRSADAPASQFSAARARVVQDSIAKEPRPIGSDANARAREYLRARLEAIGFETEIQRATSCGAHGACGVVNNLIATRPGSDPDHPRSLLLMAHYDSVPCSPGASDDGAGTSAVVEVARAVAAGPTPKRPIVILLTDGEESGLLGALAFVEKHPRGKDVAFAINVDSRGGGGASAMFETSTGNAWLVGELARHASRPVTSSLFYEIYRRMPNDTDFTAVKTTARGLNFANVARVEAYHTPLDSIANADLGTLQHHGDQALAMTRALANAEAEPTTSADAVWFDVLATVIVRWPASWSLPLALLALALVLGQTLRLRAFGRGMAAPLGVLTAALSASIAAGLLLGLAGATPVPWVAHQWAALLSLHSATTAAGAAAAILFARYVASPLALWSGTWLLWAILGVASAVIAPGASFLFVVPAVVAGLAGFAAPRRGTLASIAPACAAATLLLPIAWLANDALGLAVPALVCGPTALLVGVVAPLVVPDRATERRLRFGGVLALGAVAAIAAIAAIALPKFSAEIPQRVNVVLREDHDDPEAPARTTAFVEASWGGFAWGPAPPVMLAALGSPRSAPALPTPWSMPSPNAPQPALSLAPPTASVESASNDEGRRRVVTVVASPRGARTMMLSFGARRVVITVDGERASLRSGALLLRGVPAEGTTIALDAAGTEPIDLQLLDVTHGVTSLIARARPASARETQEGDITVVSRRLRL